MRFGGSATLAGVIGWPVAHSRSPRLHGYWLERYGIDGAYVPLAVAPKDFAECLRVLPKPGFAAWFGVDPEVTPELRAHVLRDSGA